MIFPNCAITCWCPIWLCSHSHCMPVGYCFAAIADYCSLYRFVLLLFFISQFKRLAYFLRFYFLPLSLSGTNPQKLICSLWAGTLLDDYCGFYFTIIVLSSSIDFNSYYWLNVLFVDTFTFFCCVALSSAACRWLLLLWFFPQSRHRRRRQCWNNN